MGKRTTNRKCTSCQKWTVGKYLNEPCCRACSTKAEILRKRTELETISDYDLGWLVGIIEGEGCFYKKRSVNTLKDGTTWCYPLIGFDVTMTDLDVMHRVSKLLDIPLSGPDYENDKSRKPTWHVRSTGYVAQIIANHFCSFLGKRRQQCISDSTIFSSQNKYKIEKK